MFTAKVTGQESIGHTAACEALGRVGSLQLSQEKAGVSRGCGDASARERGSESLFLHLCMWVYFSCVMSVLIPGHTEQTLAAGEHVLRVAVMLRTLYSVPQRHIFL